MAKRSPAAKAKGRGRAVMPAFIEPQLCKVAPEPPSQAGWVHEIKFDGYRMQLRIEDGAAVMLTRKGLDWTAKFRSAARAAEALPDAIIDGEIVAIGTDGVPSFASLQ